MKPERYEVQVDFALGTISLVSDTARIPYCGEDLCRVEDLPAVSLTDAQCDDLVLRLHDYARSTDIYKGLCLVMQHEIEMQRKIIREWLNGTP